MRVANEIGNLPQAIGTAATEAAKPVASGAAKANDSVQTSSQQPDRAELSSAGSLMARALGTSDVRMEKVQALQQAIASGSYHVSSSDVAGKLVDSMME